jgi:hypothetical protein
MAPCLPGRRTAGRLRWRLVRSQVVSEGPGPIHFRLSPHDGVCRVSFVSDFVEQEDGKDLATEFPPWDRNDLATDEADTVFQ